MKNGIFVTATGTDVGKTYISALLVKALREAGINAGYYKPFLSGALAGTQGLIPGDAAFVCERAGLEEPPEALVSYLFAEAVSPHLAARRAGIQIRAEKVLEDFHSIRRRYEFVVVEGAGGLFCPLNMEGTPLLLPEIIRLLELDMLIAAPSGLGAIHDTVSTGSGAQAQGLNTRGIILNRFHSESFLHQDNKTQIQALTGLPVVACVEENAKSIAPFFLL